jgi:hypothetical protein
MTARIHVRLLGTAITTLYTTTLVLSTSVQAAEPPVPVSDPQALAEAATTACTKAATERGLTVSSIQSSRPLNTGLRLVMNVKNGEYAFPIGCVYKTDSKVAAVESVTLRTNNGNWRGMGKRIREVCMRTAKSEGMKVLDVDTVNVTNEGGVLNMQLRQKNIDFRSAQCIYTDATGQADFILR